MKASRGTRAPNALAALAAFALASVVAVACQAGPAGSASAASPVIASQVVPTQVPTAAAASASSAAIPTARPTPVYPSRLRRPTGQTVDGTCDDGTTCLGLLGTDKHHSKVFGPGVSFTMPATGWENIVDEGGVFPLFPIAEPGDGIFFFRAPRITKPDGTLDGSVPSTVDGLMTSLTTNPELNASAPADVSVGGLDGKYVDLTVGPASTSHQSDCKVVACVFFFHGKDPSSKPTWVWDFGVVSSERVRVYLLQAKDEVITVIADSLDGTTWDDLTATTDELLKTVKFDGS